MSEVLQVSTATSSQEAARRLAHAAVKARLAAGGQIVGPVESVFWHAGQFGTGQEWQLLLKSTREQYPQLEAFLLEHHEWENPEIAAVVLVAGSAHYLRWVQATVERVTDADLDTGR